MQSFTCTIHDPEGLHARPASQLVKAASGYQSRILIEKAGRSADSRRLLSVMSLCIKQGEEIRVTISGADEEIAAQGMRSFFGVSSGPDR